MIVMKIDAAQVTMSYMGKNDCTLCGTIVDGVHLSSLSERFTIEWKVQKYSENVILSQIA